MEECSIFWARMMTLEALLATEASSVSADIAWTCVGGLASGHTAEVWPSFPQSLQQTLVGFLGVVEQELLLKDELSPAVELVNCFFVF